MDLDAVLESETEVFLEETDWLSEASPEELDRTYADFSSRFKSWLTAVSAKLGPPTATRDSHPELAEELYCEAFELAAWAHGPGYRVLACGQHDRDTPVFVSYSYREAHAA